MTNPVDMSRRAKTFFITSAAILVAVVALLFFASRSFSGTKEAKQHVAHVNWLPEEATDVTYVKRDGVFPFICFECFLPRQAMENLAKTKGWNLSEKKDYSTGLRSTLELPPVRKVEGMEIDFYPLALVYEDRKGNGGGITVIYDPEIQRLFVLQSAN